MTENPDAYLRQQIINHIEGGEAFTPIDGLLNKIPYSQSGIVPEGLPYSLWQQLYHIRYTQLDILKFTRDENYEAPQWPDDYWPSNPSPTSEKEWEGLKAAYQQERRAFINIVKDNSRDLFKPLFHGEGQTLFREAMLVVEHTAYHTGQMLVLMRLLNLYE